MMQILVFIIFSPVVLLGYIWSNVKLHFRVGEKLAEL